MTDSVLFVYIVCRFDAFLRIPGFLFLEDGRYHVLDITLHLIEVRDLK